MGINKNRPATAGRFHFISVPSTILYGACVKKLKLSSCYEYYQSYKTANKGCCAGGL